MIKIETKHFYIAFLSFLISCTDSIDSSFLTPSDFKSKVNQMQGCSSDSDCIVIGSICDVGCHVSINRKYKEESEVLLTKLKPCKVKCSKLEIVKCIENQCTAGMLKNKTIEIGKEEALNIAQKALVNTYGERILKQKPFKIKEDKDKWIVTGTMNCPKNKHCFGGVGRVEISKRDGKVQDIIHGK